MELTYKQYQKDAFSKEFLECIYKEKEEKCFSEIAFLCIGTDRLIGDSFGPLVGSFLKEKLQEDNILNIGVYGSLEEIVNYTNIEKLRDKIKLKNKHTCIVAIDAALSNKQNIGKIFVKRKKMLIAKGIKKKAIEVGDISIKAVVNKDYKIPKYNYMSLQNVELNMVMNLSKTVACGIYETIKYI